MMPKIIKADIIKNGKEVLLTFEGKDIDGKPFMTAYVVKVSDYYG